MSTITVKDGTTIFRTVSLPHIPDLVYRDLLMFCQESKQKVA